MLAKKNVFSIVFATQAIGMVFFLGGLFILLSAVFIGAIKMYGFSVFEKACADDLGFLGLLSSFIGISVGAFSLLLVMAKKDRVL